MRTATISAIMPNYNHGRYIAAAIESVVRQTLPPMEFLIIDDGSTDDSVKIISEYAARCPYIRLLRNERNMGVMYSSERLYSEMKGEFMFGLSADDTFKPDLFKNSMMLLAQYPKAGFCCSDSITVFEDSGLTKTNCRRLGTKPRYISPEELASMMRKRVIYLSAFGTIFRKKYLDETGLLPSLKWNADMIYATIAGLRYGFCYVPEVLSVQLYRRQSYSAAGIREKAQHSRVIAALFELLRSPGYEDVLPKFRDSGALACFEYPMLEYLVRHREFREFLTPNLVRLIMSAELKNKVGAYLPASLKKAYWAMRGHR